MFLPTGYLLLNGLCYYSKCQSGIWFLGLLSLLPLVEAAPKQQAFPNVTFHSFSQAIEKFFGSNIALSTVLFLVLTLTENSNLINLHARQKIT